MKEDCKYYSVFLWTLLGTIILSSLNLVSANNYTVDIYFMIPDSVYFANERMELKGYLYLGNYSDNGTLVSSSSALANASAVISKYFFSFS